MRFQKLTFRFPVTCYLHYVICISFCCASFVLFAQKKKIVAKITPKIEVAKIVSYELLENGDTINKLDEKNIRQGRWVIDQPAHYEEPAFMEVGSFDNGVKTGLWKTYDTRGRLISEEKFKKGNKDGEARYYEGGSLICVANYLALNAQHRFDTVMVEDPITNEFKPKIIKTDMGSVRHGLWTYYEPPSKKISRVIDYQADEIVYDKEYDSFSHEDSLYITAKMKSLPHISSSNKSSSNEWIDTKNRKKIKYTDFPDNIQNVTPNVRKK